MRWALKAAAAAIGLVLVIAIVAYGYLRQSLPTVNGEVALAGLSAPVDVVRDADDIPHIFAANKHDALAALGYVHAQDRLWQMEFQRRIGFGRLSEIFGPATLAQDRFLRTIGFGRAARAAWTRLPESAKQDVTAYVDGVNAFIRTHHGRQLPPEFHLLRFEPQPWLPEEVVVWQKMMAWDLSANYAWELLRHDLIAKVGEQKMAELMPPYPRDGLSVLSAADMTWLKKPTTVTTKDTKDTKAKTETSLLAAFFDGLDGDSAVADLLLGSARGEAIGSNNWVVDGTLTASGKPMLANDPHLAARIPSIWYLAHISAGDFDVSGATFPGTPAVALGRNRRIAWGATNVVADVEDLYSETLDDTGRSARFEGRDEPLTIVPETIVVKGAEPVHVDVRISRHGPLVSDALNANNAQAARKRPPLEPLALRWTALDPDDTTLAALLMVNEARDWTDFTAAMRTFVVPSQNFVYADADGHIGYYVPGRIPIRARGDGSRPVDGASGQFEWIGWVPFDQLPHAFDPPEHLIATANFRAAPPAYPYSITVEWIEPFRGRRIVDLLTGAHHKLTPADFAAIQADTLSLQARTILPILLARAHPRDEADGRALGLLQSWNGDTRADSAAAAVFEAWFHRLAPTLVGDELGPLLTSSYQSRFSFVTRFVSNILSGRGPEGHDSSWCDDVATPARETCDEAVSAALHEGVKQLTEQLGGDASRWTWGDAHHAMFPHQGLDSVGVLRPFVSRSMPSAGDWSTVNAAPVDTDHPFEQRNIPSYRGIFDLSSARDDRIVDAVGQSGHPLSSHYDDFLRDWRAVKYRKLRATRQEAEAGAIGHLRLIPEK